MIIHIFLTENSRCWLIFNLIFETKMHLDVKKEDHDQSCWYWVDSSPFVRCLALYFGVSWIHILQSDKPHGADPVQRRPCGLPHGWFSKSSCICLVSMSHFSCDAIITPHRLIHRSSHTFSEVVVRLNALFPQTTLTMLSPGSLYNRPCSYLLHWQRWMHLSVSCTPLGI